MNIFKRLLENIKETINNFKQKDTFNDELEDMEQEILNIKNEIFKKTLESTTHWEDIKPFCGFYKKNKKHLLIADDNNGVTDLVKDDLETIITQKDFVLKKEEMEIVSITDSLAPYRIMKTCENKTQICEVDFAIIDIVFGDFVVKNGELLYMDGIDLVEYLQTINPNIKTCLFTGCYLSEVSKEKQKIIEKLGQDYLDNNVLTKTPFFTERIIFFNNFFGFSQHK